MQPPRIFRWTDIPFLLTPSLFSVLTAILVFVSSVGLEAKALVCFVAATVLTLVGAEVRRRKAFIDSYEFKYGNIFVKRNDYKVTRVSLEEAIDSVVALYSKLTPDAEEYLHRTPVWVEFVQGLAGPKKAGFVEGDMVRIGCFRQVSGSYLPSTDVPLSSTAFEHELGHVILGRYLGSWSNTQHHKLMEDIEKQGN